MKLVSKFWNWSEKAWSDLTSRSPRGSTGRPDTTQVLLHEGQERRAGRGPAEESYVHSNSKLEEVFSNF